MSQKLIALQQVRLKDVKPEGSYVLLIEHNARGEITTEVFTASGKQVHTKLEEFYPYEQWMNDRAEDLENPTEEHFYFDIYLEYMEEFEIVVRTYQNI